MLGVAAELALDRRAERTDERYALQNRPGNCPQQQVLPSLDVMGHAFHQLVKLWYCKPFICAWRVPIASTLVSLPPRDSSVSNSCSVLLLFCLSACVFL